MKTFLLLGRTGVGKSSFVNTAFLAGAPVDDFEACTTRVTDYVGRTPDGSVRLIDSPGLAEADGGCDAGYLDQVWARLAGVRLAAVLYVTPLSEKRMRPEEKRTLEKITDRLGARVWADGWLVLTFAADVPASKRAEATDVRVADITNHLRAMTGRPGRGPQFSEFRKVLLVDNVVPAWDPRCKPLPRVLR